MECEDSVNYLLKGSFKDENGKQVMLCVRKATVNNIEGLIIDVEIGEKCSDSFRNTSRVVEVKSGEIVHCVDRKGEEREIMADDDGEKQMYVLLKEKSDEHAIKVIHFVLEHAREKLRIAARLLLAVLVPPFDKDFFRP